MAQKIVSFEVAKALKEAGYPQGNTLCQYAIKPYYDYDQERELKEGQYSESFMILGIDAPTYIDAWLWLWREKGIMIETSRVEDCVDVQVYTKDLECLYVDDQVYPDPEEAIAKVIEYLVENNLIK